MVKLCYCDKSFVFLENSLYKIASVEIILPRQTKSTCVNAAEASARRWLSLYLLVFCRTKQVTLSSLTSKEEGYKRSYSQRRRGGKNESLCICNAVHILPALGKPCVCTARHTWKVT